MSRRALTRVPCWGVTRLWPIGLLDPSRLTHILAAAAGESVVGADRRLRIRLLSRWFDLVAVPELQRRIVGPATGGVATLTLAQLVALILFGSLRLIGHAAMFCIARTSASRVLRCAA